MLDIKNLTKETIKNPHISDLNSSSIPKIASILKQLENSLRTFTKTQEQIIEEAKNQMNDLTKVMQDIDEKGLSEDNIGNLESTYSKMKDNKVLSDEDKKALEDYIKQAKQEIKYREEEYIKSLEENNKNSMDFNRN